MSEYFKGIVALLGTGVFTLLTFLQALQGWLPVVISALSAILVILVPNTRDGENVRKQ